MHKIFGIAVASALTAASPAMAHMGGGGHGGGHGGGWGHGGGGFHGGGFRGGRGGGGGGFWRNGIWVPFAIGGAALGAGAYYYGQPSCWWVQDPYYGPRQVCQGY